MSIMRTVPIFRRVRIIVLAGLVLLYLCVCPCAAPAEQFSVEADPAAVPVTYDVLTADLVQACMDPSGGALSLIDRDLVQLDDPLAEAVADHWKKTWLNPDYPLYLYNADDPALLPVTGRHAFVVLGFALRNGEMTDELIGRCEAAAVAARAFPDSILVCTGGATGMNNPARHTEAGLMKGYLADQCGIAANRIFTDELSMTTAENAVNTLAILQELRIETMTIVTSDYHQLWSQTLYHAQAARLWLKYGYSLEIIGNWNWPAASAGTDVRKAGLPYVLYQLPEILNLP